MKKTAPCSSPFLIALPCRQHRKPSDSDYARKERKADEARFGSPFAAKDLLFRVLLFHDLFQHVRGHTGSGFDNSVTVFDCFGIETALILMLLSLSNHLLQLNRLIVDVVYIGTVIRRITGFFHRIEGQNLAAHIVVEFRRIHVNRCILIILPHIVGRKDRGRQGQGKTEGQKHFFNFTDNTPHSYDLYFIIPWIIWKR